MNRLIAHLGVWLFTFLLVDTLPAQTPVTPLPIQSLLLTVEGKVEVSRVGGTDWTAGHTNQVLRVGDRLRTGARSRATVRLSNLTVLRVNELTTLQIQSPARVENQPVLDLKSGAAYLFSREKPTELEFRTPLASGAIRGTEFQLDVADDGRSVVTLIDGEIALRNELGELALVSGEQGVVEAGQPPTKTAVLNAINIIQWCLYYPGVLDVDELNLSADEQRILADSLAAYRGGDLLPALSLYPENRAPASDAEKIYRAAVVLAVGDVPGAEVILQSLPARLPLADALRELIAAVKYQTWTRAAPPVLATEWMAESYHLQSRSKLAEARQAAQAAVAKSPAFGLGWARLAELEFGFGNTGGAQAALENALRLSPRNAQALALKGFTLSAQNRIPEAIQLFDQAIGIDPALGNAWLGRGLCQIHKGRRHEGLDDLLTAAALEPQRSMLRSYLGKAFGDAGDNPRAVKELGLARRLDPNDPTSWLYSALLNQQRNQINEAVSDLEKSQELNDHRSVYRSRLLLDQDRAVRSANLANIYRDAGMTDVSAREAVKAVNSDYANYSAHLFLANSFNELRDPQRVNLRYETPYVSEYLLATLLAPVGASTLSQQVSQQEYSKLFEREGLGLSSSTEYFSHGDWRQGAAQYGTFGNSSFAVEEFYRSEHGYRPNSDFEETTYDVRLKQQLAPKDSVYIQASLAYSSGGNSAQYYDQAGAAQDPFRFDERQEPILVAGYHHEWSPGVHTLVLGSRLIDTYAVTNPLQHTIYLVEDPNRTLLEILPLDASQRYRSELEIYSMEAQQIWQTPRQTMVMGTRFQDGGFDNRSRQELVDLNYLYLFQDQVISDQNGSARFQRWNIYAYEQWQVVDSLRLIGGLSYDRLVFPEDYRFAPLSTKTETHYHLLPKAGAIWTPLKDTTLRAAFSQSVSGASFDQSFQLEPTQVAGFNQAFRSLIPESVAGANAGATFTSYGVSLEQKFPTRTYVAVVGEILESTVKRKQGAFELVDFNGPFIGTLPERLEFREKSVSISTHQLLGREWALAAIYRLSRAELDDNYTSVSDAIAAAGSFPARQALRGTLHTLNLGVIYQHPCGWFSQLRGVWTRQENGGYPTPRADADYWQWDLLAGYRFPRRRAEIVVGGLNLTGRNYRLSPLNLHQETPRDATFTAQFRFQF
ncbi:MAG: TonB-dependent receptor [Verrucomicrobia bacterium]|nr:TonB-dependent receptor [Verrucomicrobiota bacterium]